MVEQENIIGTSSHKHMRVCFALIHASTSHTDSLPYRRRSSAFPLQTRTIIPHSLQAFHNSFHTPNCPHPTLT